MISYLETHIVDHCNLNCKGCSHFSSIADKKYYDLNEFRKNLQALARVEQVGTLRIMGGEPILHPEWIEFCKSAREIFPKTNIVLVSNGILAKEIQRQAETLNDLRITLCCSDYGLKIGDLSGIKSRQTHNKALLYNISLDLSGKQDATTSFINCDLAMNKWYFLKGNRIFTCCVFAQIDTFIEKFGAEIKYDINDVSIEFDKKSSDEIEWFLAKPHEACKYCDTKRRARSYGGFTTTKMEISEWT